MFKKVRNVNMDLLSMSALNETYKEEFDIKKEASIASTAIKKARKK